MRTSLTQAEVTALRCAIPELSHIPADAPETGLGKESENLEQSYIHGEGSQRERLSSGHRKPSRGRLLNTVRENVQPSFS